MQKTPQNTGKISKAILFRLLYSEVFTHPMKSEELFESINIEDKDSFSSSLNDLVNSELVNKQEEFYFLFKENGKISNRKTGSEKANRMLPKANKIARFINKFPYIEGVGISGSLSKGVLHDDGDFDFFIITQPNRLWVARTILVIFKKLFLFNSRKYFCVNYFIDSKNLRIQEQNIFTATEITTLLPASGTIFSSFFNENKWTSNYLPQKHIPILRKIKKPIPSKLITFALKGRFGEWLDEKFLLLTLRNWQKKFGQFDHDKFDLTMKTRKYISKHHPQDFQNKVLNKHKDLIDKYKKEHQLTLSKLNIEL